MDGGGGAFGAGKAGGQFDPVAYVKKPPVILRAVSLIFAIIIFGCISSASGFNEGNCPYNNDQNACNYGITIGVLAFLGLIFFLILDAIFEIYISSIQQRKYIVIADIGFSGLWAFLWFVGFCYLCSQWNKSGGSLAPHFPTSKAQAPLAFMFFSIGSFAALTFLAVRKYRQGITEDFSAPYDPSMGGGGVGGGAQPQQSPYSQYASGTAGAGESGDPYQQSPFGQNQQGSTTTGDYNPPTYSTME